MRLHAPLSGVFPVAKLARNDILGRRIRALLRGVADGKGSAHASVSTMPIFMGFSFNSLEALFALENSAVVDVFNVIEQFAVESEFLATNCAGKFVIFD